MLWDLRSVMGFWLFFFALRPLTRLWLYPVGFEISGVSAGSYLGLWGFWSFGGCTSWGLRTLCPACKASNLFVVSGGKIWGLWSLFSSISHVKPSDLFVNVYHSMWVSGLWVGLSRVWGLFSLLVLVHICEVWPDCGFMSKNLFLFAVCVCMTWVAGSLMFVSFIPSA